MMVNEKKTGEFRLYNDLGENDDNDIIWPNGIYNSGKIALAARDAHS